MKIFISSVTEEYREARDTRPVLVFVHRESARTVSPFVEHPSKGQYSY